MVEEKLKKISFNTLDKNFLLDRKYLLSNFVEKNLLKEQEKLALKLSKNLNQNSPTNAPFYRVWKTSRWGLSGLSDDRPVVRPMVIFQTVVPSVDRPADRGQDTESNLSVRSAARGLSREQSSLDGRPGRSAGHPAELACTSVHVGRPGRSTGHSQIRKLRDLKLGLLAHIKIP